LASPRANLECERTQLDSLCAQLHAASRGCTSALRPPICSPPGGDPLAGFIS
jgi:hypothetical protein